MGWVLESRVKLGGQPQSRDCVNGTAALMLRRMMSVETFLCGELVAACVLAMWVVVRYPKLGPKTLRACVLAFAGGLVLVQLLPFGMNLAIRLPHGAYAALFGCALPCFFGLFLAAGWTMRLLAGAFGGSNGGGGIPAAARG